MKLKRKIASLLAFIMSFSTIAAFSVSADNPGGFQSIMPLETETDAYFEDEADLLAFFADTDNRDILEGLWEEGADAIPGTAVTNGFANEGVALAFVRSISTNDDINSDEYLWPAANTFTTIGTDPYVSGTAVQNALHALLLAAFPYDQTGGETYFATQVNASSFDPTDAQTEWDAFLVASYRLTGGTPAEPAVGFDFLSVTDLATALEDEEDNFVGLPVDFDGWVALATFLLANNPASPTGYVGLPTFNTSSNGWSVLYNAVVETVAGAAATDITINATTTVAGTNTTFTLTAVDAAGPGATWTLVDADPALGTLGLTFNVGPGTITGNNPIVGTSEIEVSFTNDYMEANGGAITETFTITVTAVPVIVPIETARLATNTFLTPNQVTGALPHLESNWVLHDRYVELPSGVNNVRAPEVVIPANQLAGVASITFTLGGWGDNPWSTLVGVGENATNLHMIEWNPDFAGTSVPHDTAFEDSGWMISQPTPTHLIYTGFAQGDGYFGELPFALEVRGQSLIVTPLRAVNLANYVLRIPLIANQGTNRDIPTLTMERGNNTFDLQLVAVGAGVQLVYGNVVYGRDRVTLNTLTIRENALNAFIPNGQIALALPFGYRFAQNTTSGGTPTSPRVAIGSGAGEISLGNAITAGVNIYMPTNVYRTDQSTEAIATLPRDGVVAQSVLVIELPASITRPVASVASALELSGITVVSTATRWDAPITGDVYLTMYTGANALGFAPRRPTVENGTTTTWPASGIGLREAYRSTNRTEVHVATFADFGVTFSRISGGGGVGNIPTIVGGWLPAEGNQAGRSHPTTHERSTGRNITTGNAAFGNVASVRVAEVVPESLWGTHGWTFTLVDSEGNPHPYASIRNVFLQSTVVGVAGDNVNNLQGSVGGNFINIHQGGANHHQVTNHITASANAHEADGTRGPATVRFSEDGRSVAVDRLEVANAVRNQARLQLDAHFGITADVNFAGDVYVVVSRGGLAFTGGFDQMDLAPVHVAEVRRGIYLETENTVVTVGFQTFEVADIRILESQPGDFRSGTNAIQVTLGEYRIGQLVGQSNVQFIPITVAQAANHITIGGAVNAQSRVGATIQPFHGMADSININIGAPTRGDEPSYIHLSNLAVRAVRDVPFGTYELVVRGTSVLNNENFWDLQTPGLEGRPFLLPNELGFQRFGHAPLMYLDYINIGTPGGITVGTPGGAFDPAELPTITVPHAPGTTFYVNGEARTFANGQTSVNLGTPAVVNTVAVPAGRLFVPFREVVEALAGYETGGDVANPIVFHQGNLFMDLPHTIVVTIADRTATFLVGRNYFIQSGAQIPMVEVDDVIAPFVGDGVNGQNGRTYLPLRFIANAFGLEVQANVNGNAIIN